MVEQSTNYNLVAPTMESVCEEDEKDVPEEKMHELWRMDGRFLNKIKITTLYFRVSLTGVSLTGGSMHVII